MDIDQTFSAIPRKGFQAQAASPVASGFPSPSAGLEGLSLSLDQHLVERPSATYFCQVSGDAMILAGIHDGDLLVVDSSLPPLHGRVVVAVIFGELVVRRLHIQSAGRWLLAETSDASIKPLDITRYDQDQLFWGVVTWVLHRP
ncbi:MAG: LexA family transcriptional regulator [Marinospirillum sp.]|uniref:LexA family protein n=1 Tax=Marinospirillum sp. TaxID=2183934 RepID=UPI0019F7B509|nr:S24 family peptidase [Marinospirillum sp.]MBE0508536.1 LexA family transcriptional regulator [Marinospirillum sp.]